MAERPAWTLTDKEKIDIRYFSFEWNGGFAVSQKKKNIINLHTSMNKRDCHNIIEISTKSDNSFGINLSAFNLKLHGYYLENIFQSSKVYENGGPYLDLLNVEPKSSKRDLRHSTSGRLIGFFYDDIKWGLIPRTVFYDYIYILAAKSTVDEKKLKNICNYDWFTDIEFNPRKSINCQARSAALLKYIAKNNAWNILQDIDEWIELHKYIFVGEESNV